MNQLEQNLQIPIVASYDVIVCGGGPAGISAAISSARQGMKTLLIEAGGMLGGVWTQGLIALVLDVAGKSGILTEIKHNLDQHDATKLRHPGTDIPSFTYDVETMKVVVEKMVVDAGVTAHLHSSVVDAIVEQQIITTIITESYSGREAFTAKMFVDCTGNGALAAYAKCNYNVGHPQNGKTQPATLSAVITGVPADHPGIHTMADKQAFLQLLNEYGIFPSLKAPGVMWLPGHHLMALGVNHEYGVRCDSTLDITNASIRSRQEVFSIVKAMKKMPGWENVQLVATSSHIGIREGRRIEGLVEVKVDDIVSGRRYEDGICLVNFAVDIHALEYKDGGGYTDNGLSVKPYHIPLRSLIAKNCLNLAMAGRNVSGDFFAHASYRVTGNAVPMGEAVGLLVADAIQNQLTLHEVDGKKISHQMKDRGYDL